MKKMKYKNDKHAYRVYLTNEEAELIAHLVQHVQTNAVDNRYKDAAFNLCEMFDSVDDGFSFEELKELMTLSAMTTPIEGLIIDVSLVETADNPSEDTCCGNCSGKCNSIQIHQPTGTLLPTAEVIEHLRNAVGERSL